MNQVENPTARPNNPTPHFRGCSPKLEAVAKVGSMEKGRKGEAR